MVLLVGPEHPQPRVVGWVQDAQQPLGSLGLTYEAVVEVDASYARLRQDSLCPDRFPRRSGAPTKRPLF